MAGHSKWSEIKRRKGLTESRERARQASLRAIAGGDRPEYRPQVELKTPDAPRPDEVRLTLTRKPPGNGELPS